MTNSDEKAQVIPEAAVEAAMRAFDPSWDTVPPEWRDYFLRRTHAALEAAAPHIAAAAWDEGHLMGWNEATANGLPERESLWRNPYRPTP